MTWYVADEDGYISGPWPTKKDAQFTLDVVHRVKRWGPGDYEVFIDQGSVYIMNNKSDIYKRMSPEFPR